MCQLCILLALHISGARGSYTMPAELQCCNALRHQAIEQAQLGVRVALPLSLLLLPRSFGWDYRNSLGGCDSEPLFTRTCIAIVD